VFLSDFSSKYAHTLAGGNGVNPSPMLSFSSALYVELRTVAQPLGRAIKICFVISKSHSTEAWHVMAVK
jgi:hypothetical protein